MSAVCKQEDSRISQQSPNLHAPFVPGVRLPHHLHCLMQMLLLVRVQGPIQKYDMHCGPVKCS